MTIPPLTPQALSDLRARMPITERCAYLNHAGVAPTSRDVQDAVAGWMRSAVERAILDVDAWRELLPRTRALGARLLGCDADEVAFVRNTSHGLALVAEGLPWQPGDRVAVASSVEYPSNVYPWQHLATRGVELTEIQASQDGGVTPDAVAAALAQPGVRLLTLSSTQYSSGAVADLERIGALCREREVLLCVDGIQSVGALPIDVKRAGISFLSADSHKWMLGVSGIGLLYVDRAQLERVRPSAVGWKSTTDAWNFDRALFELAPSAERFEEGSPAFALTAGLEAALSLLLEVGVPRIAARVGGLIERAAGDLEALGCAVGPDANRRRHVLTFQHPALAAERIAAALEAKDVVISVRRGRIRVSPHVYTSEEEIDRVAEVLRDLL